MVADPENNTPQSSASEQVAALLASNAKRRKVRRIVLLIAAPLLLCAAVFTVKSLSMYLLAYKSLKSYFAVDYAAAARHAQWQQPLQVLDRYTANYNLGTTLAATGKLAAARDHLQLAITQDTGVSLCAAHYNLATVIERQGDAKAQKSPDAANELYKEALGVLAKAPPACITPQTINASFTNPQNDSEATTVASYSTVVAKKSDPADGASPDKQRSMRESIKFLHERISKKITDQQQNSNGGKSPQNGGGSGDSQQDPPAEPPPGSEQEQNGENAPPDEGPNQSQLEDIRKKMQKGQEQRQQRQDSVDDKNGSAQSRYESVDKPW